MQGLNQTTSAPNAIAKRCRLETISRAGSPNVTPTDAMLKIWPVVVMIAALTSRMSHEGERAPGGRMQDATDRAPPHWLNPLFCSASHSSFGLSSASRITIPPGT